MILRIKGFNLEIEVHEETVAVLEILNKTIFRTIIGNILSNIEGMENNDVVIEDQGKIIKYAKEVMCVHDYLNIDFKTKAIIRALYSRIEENINLDVNVRQKIEYEVKMIGNLLFSSALDTDLGISYNSDIPIAVLLKTYDFQINALEYSSALEQLLLLIDIYGNFKLGKLIIFVNLRAYFTQGEITEIYTNLQYKKVNYICIESGSCDTINIENLYIIDEDLVEFAHSN